MLRPTTARSSAYGITFYGTLDVGFGYQEWGTPFRPERRQAQLWPEQERPRAHLAEPFNALSTNVLGLKMKEDLAPLGLPGWSLVGVLEAGFNPYSGMFINGPRAMADNNVNKATGRIVTINGKKYRFTTTGRSRTSISSRAGQWNNSQGYIGFGNKPGAP